MSTHPRTLSSATVHPPRRRWIRQAAAVAASVGLPGWLSLARAQPGTLTLTPSQAEGPFYPILRPADVDADLLRQGAVAYAKGQPAWIRGTVVDLEGVPVSGAAVEIWQCDQDGHYHHPGDGGRADPAFQGFGHMTVGRDGGYRFRTIRPVPYSGRTPHIHFKVRLGPHELLTTQLYVAGEPGNERDFLWRRLSPQQRQALTVPFHPHPDGWQADFRIVVLA